MSNVQNFYTSSHNNQKVVVLCSGNFHFKCYLYFSFDFLLKRALWKFVPFVKVGAFCHDFKYATNKRCGNIKLPFCGSCCFHIKKELLLQFYIIECKIFIIMCFLAICNCVKLYKHLFLLELNCVYPLNTIPSEFYGQHEFKDSKQRWAMLYAFNFKYM